MLKTTREMKCRIKNIRKEESIIKKDLWYMFKLFKICFLVLFTIEG